MSSLPHTIAHGKVSCNLQRTQKVTLSLGALWFTLTVLVFFSWVSTLRAAPSTTRIPAADYIAYSDTTRGNTGRQCRADDVDLGIATEDGTCYIGWIAAGEWTEYTFDASNIVGPYEIHLRVATPYYGKQMRVLIDGMDASGPIKIPVTGSWQVFQTVVLSDIPMTPTLHTIRLEYLTSAFNVHWLEIYGATRDFLDAVPRWEARMTTYGEPRCQELLTESDLADVYYDAAWVFYQMGDYTGDPSWYTCAEQAITIYRDGYVLPNDGNVKGTWIFPHGLEQHYLRTDDQQSKEAIIKMSWDAAYAPDNVPLSWTRTFERSREVAYNVMNYIIAERLGQVHRPRLDALVQQMYGHLDQWFISQTAEYIRPFMVALTSHALIMHYEQTGDPQVLPNLEMAWEWLWNNTWLPEEKAFMYTDRPHSSGGTGPAPDLNLLIVPVFSWLYQQTGEAKWLHRGDQIFIGGVTKAYLGAGKHFNQNYRWSFDYVQVREATTLLSSVVYSEAY